MALLNNPVVLALLKNKLFLASGGTLTIGGVVTPVVLTSTSSTTNIDLLSSKPFFTKEKLSAAIDDYKKGRPEQSTVEVYDQNYLLGETEVTPFLLAAQNISDYQISSKGKNFPELTKDQRSSLSIFCNLYASIESSKENVNLNTIGAREGNGIANLFKTSIACKDLDQFKGNEEKWQPMKSINQIDNGGGKSGAENPFRHFYESEEIGKEQMQKIELSQSNINSVELRKMEYNISSGIVREMKRIHEKYF